VDARWQADARGLAPGAIGPAVADTESRFEELVDAAPHEQRVRRLSEAVQGTTRRRMTLEHRLAPGLIAQINAVRQQLE